MWLNRSAASLRRVPGSSSVVSGAVTVGRHRGRVLRAGLAEDVQDTLESERPGFDADSVRLKEPLARRRVIAGEVVADRLQRDLEVAQPDDGPSRLELVSSVQPIARERIRSRRPEQVEFVVVPQGTHAQPGQPGEPPDREKVAQVFVVHAAIVDLRPTRESSALRRVGRVISYGPVRGSTCTDGPLRPVRSPKVAHDLLVMAQIQSGWHRVPRGTGLTH